MITRSDASRFLESAGSLPVIDVRSPKEYLQGHIPGAFNLPLFDDEERAVVGTIYKNSGRDSSVLRGMEMAGPRMASYVKKALLIAPRKEVLIHCWRGGMRSENMGWLLDQAGFRITLLEGGYKAYRKFIRSDLIRELNLVILGGMTGSGKTEILKSLQDLGEQVIDLEKIASHKGSVFGALGEDPQPTNEQFENELYAIKQQFDLKRPVWVEDESRMLGNITIPDPFFRKMQDSPLVRIDVPVTQRISRLVSIYSHFTKEELKDALGRISEKLGGTRTKMAVEAVDEGRYAIFAELVLSYYDKAYLNAITKRISREIYPVFLEGEDPVVNAGIILRRVKVSAKPK